MTFRSLCACLAALALFLSGCANDTPPRQTARPLSQKTAPSPTGISPSAGVAPRAPLAVNAPPVTAALLPPALPSAPPGKIKAAVLLPLSGKNAALGQAMLNAAQQAVFDAAGNNFELQPHDTGAPGGADAAARAAVAAGAQLIIGPLFAADVPLVRAASGGLPILALSTDTSLASPGVYVMGLAPGPQAERVVTYALAHGARRFAALVPATPYGTLTGQDFQTAVIQGGGSVADYETYEPGTQQVAARAQQMAGEHAGIDALFLPDAGNDLKIIADQLAAGGITAARTHILGTGLWDASAIGRQNPPLIGSWYAAPDPAARRGFIAGYQAAYGMEPPRLATLAYDATALAALLAKRGNGYMPAELTNPNGFAGLDGIFRLRMDGTVERALAVEQVTADGAQMIDPAPVSFVTRR